MALFPMDKNAISPICLKETIWWKTKDGDWKSGEVIKITEKLVKHYATGEEYVVANVSVRYKKKDWNGNVYNGTLGNIKHFYREKPE